MTWRTATVAALAAVLLALTAVAGCATVPDTGPVQQVGSPQGGASQPQAYSQPIAVGPGRGWRPAQIVQGFLAAGASFAGNHAVAQQYLDSAARRSWRPGWAVTVVNTVPATSVVPPPGQLGGGTVAERPAASTTAMVEVTASPAATITRTGQYLVSASPSPMSLYFSLAKVHGQWRIQSLPDAPLPMTAADFQRVYQPRNLYFPAPSGHVLVPDAVFAPLEATNTELATGLVNALAQGPTGWLNGAATTAFPVRFSSSGHVKIIGPNAVVNLTGKAASLSRRKLQQIAAQLVWTLVSGSTGIHSVELEINGRPQKIQGTTDQLQQTYRDWVPPQPSPASLYFISGNGAVDELSAGSQAGISQPSRAAPVPGPAGTPQAPALRSIAISPTGRWLAGISADGSAVYTADLSHGGALRAWRSPSGSCTSVSWDSGGNLWISAGGDLWLMQPSSGIAGQVGLQGLPDTDSVTDFRVAPDGVRAVMIVSGPGGKQVQLGAITRSGSSAVVGQTVTLGASISGPQALSWDGTDNVIVLAQGGQGPQLNAVKLNGGLVTPIATPASTVSVTATNPQTSAGSTGLYAAVGLSSGQIMVSSGGVFQPAHVTGRDPVYPG